MSKSQSQSRFRREELRGLFVLGLLAVVASMRIQSSEIMITINGISHNVTHFLDVMLITWSFYAFFMVFGLSEDFIGEKASNLFLKISTQYLYISFMFIGFFGVIFFNTLYPNRAIWIFAYVGIAICYFLIKWAYSILKKIPEVHRPSKSGISQFIKKLYPKLKNFFPTLLLAIFMNSFLLILYGVYTDLIIPSFIVGSACLIIFLIYRDLTKKDEI